MAMRSLSAVEAQSLGVRGVSGSGDSDAPAVEVSNQFPLQSYLDSTLGPLAILRQPPNDQIVTSTRKSVELAGYAVGLHPSSDTPVGIQFKGGQQQGGSPTYRLKPGEVIRPFGSPGVPGKFSGFEWGLPFGWLGGGNAMLVVFRTVDAGVDWNDRSELVYHRVRLPIVAPASVPDTLSLIPNWPNRFPWINAKSGTNQLPQGGQPLLAVSPTRTVMRLRTANLAAAATMRVYMIGMDEFAEAQGVVDLTDCLAYDVTWGAWASIASAQYASQYQTQFFSGELEVLGANSGGAVVFVDASGGVLAGTYVDVIRYGVL